MHEPSSVGPAVARRRFLRAAGVAMALPFLESSRPARGSAGADPRRRMVCIMTNMGVMPRHFFPAGAGRDYAATPYLEILGSRRADLTVFSGLSHPGVGGAHLSEKSFLTAAPGPAASSFRNTISLDQFAAERMGGRTRFPSLALMVGRYDEGLPSTTRDGVPIPPETSPAALYRRLFMRGGREEVEAREAALRHGRSLLDFARGEARQLARDLPPADRHRLDQYFTSIRDLEEGLRHAQAWEETPRPRPSAPGPRDIPDEAEVEAQTGLMYDMIRLALESDSTRVVTLYLGPLLVTPKIPGVANQTHALTHHGHDEAKMAELRKIEEAHFRALARLLDGLAAVGEGDATLLDRSMVLYGSNLGDANSHDTSNLPILLAGGGFRHGQHLAFDRANNSPLANLFVTMLQRLGLEVDRFASSTGTLRGLEAS